MNAVTATATTRPHDGEHAQPVIDVRGLVVGWGDRVLVRDVSFRVYPREIFAILGASGSGKTTLMRYLVGLDPPLAGELDVAGHGMPQLEEGLPPFGVMFQGGALLGSRTVEANVALPLEEWTDLPPDAIGAIVRAKLRMVGLEGAASKIPSELSGGMMKRAAIARALAVETQLVFLDEPASGLDPVTAAELDDLILSLRDTLGLTVVVVTHELESIFRIADRCLMLDRDSASVIATGDPRLLKNSDDPRVSAFFNRRSREPVEEEK